MAMLAGPLLLLAACSVPNGSSGLHDARDFQSVRLDISGGACAACWRAFTVERPGVLTLADDTGQQRVELPDAEYAGVVDLAAGEAVQRETSGQAEPCSQLLDVEVIIDVRWSDDTEAEAVVSDGCFGHCDDPGHPLMALKRMFFELKERYMQPLCPPNRERYPEYCGNAPEPPPPPESRMLCAVCLDDCGIPMPEGVPERGPVPHT